MKQVWLRRLINKMTAYIRDPYTGKTFEIEDWEQEKVKRKEQMQREWRLDKKAVNNDINKECEE